jgi:hypothetical protein
VLEPCNAKVLRTVLRGLGASNGARLLGEVAASTHFGGYGVNQTLNPMASNEKGLGDRGWQSTMAWGINLSGAARNQSPEAADIALAYSEANGSLSGYCSLNSRNNLCARAFCFSRRAARARIILANGRR